MKVFDVEELKRYAYNFSESEMWDKIKTFFIKAGINLVLKVLQLWYVLQKPDVPKHIKLVVMGAIAYFVMPVDMIPDVLPGGYQDDVLAVAAAFVAVEDYIDEEVRKKAGQKLIELLDMVMERE